MSTMSHSTAMLQPSPTAGPLTAAITGSGNRSISSMISAPSRRLSSRATGSSRNEVIQSRSPPAEKARPAPVRITTRASRSAASWRHTSARARCSGSLTALSSSGRFDDDGADRAVGLDPQLVGQVVGQVAHRRGRTVSNSPDRPWRPICLREPVAGGRQAERQAAQRLAVARQPRQRRSRRRTRWRRGAGGRRGTRSRPPRPPPAAAPGRRPRASGRPASMLHSAYLASSSTPLRSTSASVSWNCTPWNVDSGWPNCWRSST